MAKGKKSENTEVTGDPLEIDLKMPPKDWILYWKLKYERSHLAHVEQRVAAKTILDQRDAAVRMLNELPRHKIMELQDEAEKRAKKSGKSFVVPKSLADISKAQRATTSKKNKGKKK